jgi:hypothetical protein
LNRSVRVRLSNLAFRQLKYRSLRPTTDAIALPQPEPRAVG